MADVFNKEPVEFVDLNELFPVLNSAVGLTLMNSLEYW